MRKPTNKLLLAAAWLEAYDEEAKEAAVMVEVAAWLRATVSDSEARSVLRQAGVPPSALNVKRLTRVAG